MPRLPTLLAMLEELQEQLAVCNRCGLCQAVCPLFAATGREADVARGKLALLNGLAQDLLQDPQGVLARLQRCLLCGACAASCPSGVRVTEIFLRARAVLTGYLGLPPWQKVLFRHLLAQPRFFHRLLALGAKCQGFFLKPADEILGSSCARFLSPLLQERHV
ncbi:MAG: 4Fe-4S dicluster domain-containing protein, partial [Desulfobacca sp.]|uniref:4Fe-4S dicluster domain-containing protein n=1 Tax=Desulfobacca sp. TaxID=2067990 RepID=UPI00404A9749